MSQATTIQTDASVPSSHAATEAEPRGRFMSRLVDYYELTKPRMNLLVVLTTATGFYMATREAFDWVLFLHTMLGTALSAAGAATLNQLMERHHDALMPRTRNRPLPAGRLKPLEAMAFGVLLALLGVTYLSLLVNPLTAILSAITVLSYLLVYTPAKRRTTLNTLIGAVPGAIPPMMGWTAVANNLAAPSWALFGILFFWQMPHFLAIAIMYRDDYRAGGFKMLPVVEEDLKLTSRMIVLYALTLMPVSLMPMLLGIAGRTYAVGALVLGLLFLYFSVRCARSRSRNDARSLFFASIIYLPLLFILLVANRA